MDSLTVIPSDVYLEFRKAGEYVRKNRGQHSLRVTFPPGGLMVKKHLVINCDDAVGQQ